jgi:hypothetical protein
LHVKNRKKEVRKIEHERSINRHKDKTERKNGLKENEYKF